MFPIRDHVTVCDVGPYFFWGFPIWVAEKYL